MNAWFLLLLQALELELHPFFKLQGTELIIVCLRLWLFSAIYIQVESLWAQLDDVIPKTEI